MIDQPNSALPSSSIERRRRFISVAAIFLLAAAVRLLVWSQARDTALDSWHLWDQSDMATYLEQSRRLAAGDWAARDPYLPYHLWQRFAPPEQWQSWYPPAAFHQAPVYSYVLAAARSLTPRFIDWIKLAQLLIGALSAVLVFTLAGKVAGRLAGIIAGVIAALYGPMIYLEFQLLKEPISIALMLGALIVLYDAHLAVGPGATRPSFKPLWRFAVSGILLGVLSMAHETGRVVLIAAALSLFLILRSSRASAFAAFGLFIVGALIGFAPLLFRNLIAGAPAFAVSSRSVVVFAMSHDPSAPSGGSLWGVAGPGLAALLDQSGGKSSGLIGALWKAHEGDAGLFLHNMFAKFRAACAVFEAPDNTSYAFYRSRLTSLRPMPGFWLIFAPGLVGAFATAIAVLKNFMIRGEQDSGREPDLDDSESPHVDPFARARADAALLIVLLSIGGALTLVHNIGRLRLFIVPSLIVFSAVFFARLIDATRRGDRSLLAAKGAALWIGLAAAAFQLHAQSVTAPPSARSSDYVVAANLERAAGDLDRAIDDYRAAIDLGSGGPEIHLALGTTLWIAARPSEAINTLKQAEQRGVSIGRNSAPVDRMLAWCLATCPDPALRDGEAALALATRAANATGSDSPRALEALAAARAELGEFDAARSAADRALTLATSPPDRLLAERLRAALRLYEQDKPYRTRW